MFISDSTASDRVFDISRQGIDFIKQYEGFSDVPYKGLDNQFSIGYGHQLTHTEQLTIKKITKPAAEKLMRLDLLPVIKAVNKVAPPSLTQGQFDALCSLVYNWGIARFINSRGYKFLQKGRLPEAAVEFFDKKLGVVHVNGKFCQGLYSRRQAELTLWSS